MKKIKIKTFIYVLVDDEDYERLNKYRWTYNPYMKYVGRQYKKAGKIHLRLMHRDIIKTKKHSIDHINRNLLDNRKENLRACTRQQNYWNSGLLRNKVTSIYKGVCFHKQHKKFHARIRHNGKQMHLGLFMVEKDAALAYDRMAMKLRGKYARINFPKLSSSPSTSTKG